MTQPTTRQGRRLISAGHAILAALVALGVGTLLNADALLDTAEGLDFGARRTVALWVMRPVHSVAESLHLTAPRERLDTALGHRELGSDDDPFERFATTATTTPGTTPGAPTSTTSTTRPPRPAPTAADPLRVWVAGDSLAFEYGKAVIRGAEALDLVEAVPEVDYHVATGLSRPDRFDWPAELAGGMEAHDPDVVVFMVGSNDDQGVTDPSGAEHGCCQNAGWRAEYGRRVGAVMDQVAAQDRAIVWVGVPIMGGSTGSRNPRYEVINEVARARASERPDAFFLDSWDLFVDEEGGYARFLDGEKLRADDDVHLERAGGDRLAAATIGLLASKWGFEDALPDDAPAPTTPSTPAPTRDSTSPATVRPTPSTTASP